MSEALRPLRIKSDKRNLVALLFWRVILSEARQGEVEGSSPALPYRIQKRPVTQKVAGCFQIQAFCFPLNIGEETEVRIRISTESLEIKFFIKLFLTCSKERAFAKAEKNIINKSIFFISQLPVFFFYGYVHPKCCLVNRTNSLLTGLPSNVQVVYRNLVSRMVETCYSFLYELRVSYIYRHRFR